MNFRTFSLMSREETETELQKVTSGGLYENLTCKYYDRAPQFDWP